MKLWATGLSMTLMFGTGVAFAADDLETDDAIERDARRTGEAIEESAEDAEEKAEEAGEDAGDALRRGRANAAEAANDLSAGVGGIEVSAGGGLTGFFDTDSTDVTSPGISYAARVQVRPRRVVGYEAGYLGSVQDVDATGLASGAALVSAWAGATTRSRMPILIHRRSRTMTTCSRSRSQRV
jgi:hypothetical protein